jgi:hypothetical protein
VNFKTTGVLLVLVVFGGALWLLQRGKAPPEQEPEGPTPAQAPFVLSERPEDKSITRVSIERPGKPRIVFEREPGDEEETPGEWKMTEPVESVATNYMVNSLISTLLNLRTQREADVKAADAGLEPPRATFTLAGAQDKEYVFSVGSEVPFSNDTYLRASPPGGESSIHVVSRNFDVELDRDANAYRDKTLAKFPRKDAVAVEIDYEHRTYRFTRGESDEWVVDEPVKAYADKDKIKQLINNVGNLRVQEFIDNDPESLAPYGLDDPSLTISVRTETQEPVQPLPEAQTETQPAEPQTRTVVEEVGVAVGAFSDLDKKNRYVRRLDQPWVASVPNASVERLIPNLSELRDNRVTRVKSGDVTKVEIDWRPGAAAPHESAALVRQAGRWKGEGDLQDLEIEAVRDLLSALEQLRAIDYIDEPEALSEYGLDDPRCVIRITTRGSVEPLTLKIGANTPSGRNTYVQVEGQSSVQVVSDAQAERLAINPISLRSRVIFDFKPEMFRRIELTVDTDGSTGSGPRLARASTGPSSAPAGETAATVRRVLVHEEGRWEMREPAGAPVDNGALQDLLKNLPRLGARRVAARGAFDEYGLDDPIATLHFVVDVKREETSDEASTQPTSARTSEPTTETVGHTLRMARVGDATYARRDDGAFVFELNETLDPVLTAELIDRNLFDFKPKNVTGLTIRSGETTLAFERGDSGWTYAPDPFVQLADKKVNNALGKLTALQVKRYLAYSDGDLAAAGLTEAPITITLARKGAEDVTLRITDLEAATGDRTGAWVEPGRIFRLPAEALDGVSFTLDGYVAEESES